MDGHDNNTDNQDGGAQGIYSTPDLTVNSENIAQQSAGSDDKARIASAFASTDATQQANDFANRLNGMATPQAAEEIKLNNSKKQSKVPIITAVVLILIAVIGAVAWMITSMVGGSDNNPQEAEEVTAAQVKQYYNSFINYLYSGKNSDQDVAESLVLDESYSVFTPDSVYAESVIARDADINTSEYLIDLENKYKIFAEAYVSVYKSELSPAIHNYFYDYAHIEKFTSEQLMQLFLTNGLDSAKAVVSDTYSKIYNNESLQKYVSDLKLIDNYQLDYLSLAQRHNCIAGATVDSVCLNDYEVEFSTLMVDEVSAAYVNALQLEVSLREEAMGEIVRLYEQLYNKDVTQVEDK